MLARKQPDQIEMASPRARNDTGGLNGSWTYNGLPRYNEKSRMINHKIGFHRTQIK
jgi:hypothetical protein